jgi:4'-phosphopantetheinyl transferase
LAVLHSEADCVVISVATRHSEKRPLARLAIRVALKELLANYWQQPADSIHFSDHMGHALTLLSPASPLGLSISHSPGCSVAAVHMHRAVGVDVMRVDADLFGVDDSPSNWEQLTRDYLGPVTHQHLLQSVPHLRARNFAQAWCQLEARLKCLGLGLTEWNPSLGQALDSCKVTALALPDTLCGALAVGPLGV